MTTTIDNHKIDLNGTLFLKAMAGGIYVEWVDTIVDSFPLPKNASPKEVAGFLFENGVTKWLDGLSMAVGTKQGFEEDDLRAVICDEMDRLMEVEVSA